MKFSVIHASRGRPFRAAGAINAMLGAASGNHEIEYLLAYDTEPEHVNEYAALKHQRLISLPQPMGSTSTSAWNAAAKVSTGDMLILASDHTTYPAGWDEMMYQVVKEIIHIPMFLCVDDGDSRPHYWANFATINRAYYDTNGYFFYPAYHHYYVDPDLYDQAKLRGMVVEAKHIKLHFKHYSNGSVPKDGVYVSNEAKIAQDAALYAARKARNFKD